MSASSPVAAAFKRPATLMGSAALLIVVVVWLLAFYLPQGSKLTSLRIKEVSLRQAVAKDDAKLRQLRNESHHAAQLGAMYSSLSAYVPSTEDLYTYIQTLSGAAKAAGVTITSIAPNSPVPVAGSGYSAIPISTAVKATYDHLLALLHAIYSLPRLTDIDSLMINGGGPNTNRAALLNVTLQLSIFTTSKAASG